MRRRRPTLRAAPRGSSVCGNGGAARFVGIECVALHPFRDGLNDGRRQLCARHSIVAAGLRARRRGKHVDAPHLGVAAGEPDDKIRGARAESPAVLTGLRAEAQADVDRATVLRAQLLRKRPRQGPARDDAAIDPRHDDAAAPVRLLQQRAAPEDTDQQTRSDRSPLGPRPLTSGLLGSCSGLLRRAQQPVRHRFFEHAGECAADFGAHRAMPLDFPRDLRIDRHFRFDRAAGLGIELAVGVGHQCFRRELHDRSPGRSLNKACSASRPRASRLVNVPIGTSSTSAASL
jgi:hypothetical protein